MAALFLEVSTDTEHYVIDILHHVILRFSPLLQKNLLVYRSLTYSDIEPYVHDIAVEDYSVIKQTYQYQPLLFKYDHVHVLVQIHVHVRVHVHVHVQGNVPDHFHVTSMFISMSRSMSMSMSKSKFIFHANLHFFLSHVYCSYSCPCP